MEVIEESWVIELDKNCYFDSFERSRRDELELYDSDLLSDGYKYTDLEEAKIDLETIRNDFNYKNARILKVQTTIEEEY